MLHIINAIGSEKKPYDKDEVFKSKLLPAIKRTNTHLEPELLTQYLFELKAKINVLPNICKKNSIDIITIKDLMHRLVIILKILSNRHKKVGAAILNQFQIYHNISFKSIPTKEQDILLIQHR